MKDVFFLILTIALVFSSRAQVNRHADAQEITDSVFVSISEQDALLDRIDSIFAAEHVAHFNNDSVYITGGDSSYKSQPPYFSDAIYAGRIEKLNQNTPMDLVFNKYVKNYISAYANTKNTVIKRMLGLAPQYFPVFEEHLDKSGLPLELKYLPIVESALNPKAKSRSGAKGLWQFMYKTGKIYGLEVTSYYDERSDVYKSTIAACQYLKRLNEIYGNWELTLAAYNCGPGNVNKAIRRSGGHRDYWEIRDFLPVETRNYVPAFIAVNYIMNYAPQHHIYPIQKDVVSFSTDTILVKKYVSFDQVAEVLGIPMEQIAFLNPTYKQNFIPNVGNAKTLCLPSTKIGAFLRNEEKIYAQKTQEDIRNISSVKKNANFEQNISKQPIVYKVKNGDVLGKIAERHRCRVSQIKQWNNLHSDRLKIGQTLYIYAKPSYMAQNEKKEKVDIQKAGGTSSKTQGYVYHTIKKGDNLWDIARNYSGVSVSQLQKLNPYLRFKNLKLGSKIKIKPIG